jgi:hypothetical protein
MKTVSYRDIATAVVAAGRGKRLNHVIHNGFLKQWVGIGWIEIRLATPADYEKYPQVEEMSQTVP